jgi:hypothetical protein
VEPENKNKNESESSQARGGDLWVQRNTRLFSDTSCTQSTPFFDRYASIILYKTNTVSTKPDAAKWFYVFASDFIFLFF